MTDPKKPDRFQLANGAMLQAPIFEPHYRGSNWMAVIDVDGTAPGGLSRRFIPHGKGDCLYLVEQVALFDAVEFSADYTTSVGRKHKKRWYGVVVGKTDDEIIIVEEESGSAAAVHAKRARIDPRQRAAALAEERISMLKKIDLISEEIDGLLREPDE